MINDSMLSYNKLDEKYWHKHLWWDMNVYWPSNGSNIDCTYRKEIQKMTVILWVLLVQHHYMIDQQDGIY